MSLRARLQRLEAAILARGLDSRAMFEAWQHTCEHDGEPPPGLPQRAEKQLRDFHATLEAMHGCDVEIDPAELAALQIELPDPGHDGEDGAPRSPAPPAEGRNDTDEDGKCIGGVRARRLKGFPRQG